MTQTRVSYGRSEIYTDAKEVNASNVRDVLSKTKSAFEKNQGEIQYLYDYYRGKQEVLFRQKTYNKNVCNKLIVNRANEIVSFKTGYLVGEPIQYINNSEDNSLSASVKALNDFMSAEDKAAKDRELAEWVYIAGVGYRCVLPDSVNEEDEAPFEIYTLDPRQTYIVRNSGLGHKPVMSVQVTKPVEGDTIYSVYTPTMFFEIQGDKIVKQQGHLLGGIPVIEYRFNNAMIGAFELVLTALDAINEIGSNRLDAIENFVQAFLVFKGIDMSDEQYRSFLEQGGICLPDGDTDVKYLVQEMNQAQTQTEVDDLYQTLLTICGMPFMNTGNTSDSSNNGAVILRNGWTLAEARAKDDENMFKKSEKQFLKIALRICNKYRESFNLKLFQIEPRFTRRNYENALEKAQILTMLLSTEKVHPRLAYEVCGLFIDPETAYITSEKYAEEREKKQLDELEKADKTQITVDGQTDETVIETEDGAA